MTAFTKEQIKETAQKVVDQIGDTIELEDLQVVVPAVMEIADKVMGMTGEEKHKTVMEILEYVLESTDTPWLPDAITDPLFLKLADLVLIPLIARAAKGEFAINAGETSPE